MKKITTRMNVATVGALVASLALAVPFAQAAMITNQLDMGSTGADVTSLQTYLSTDASLYPSGLVTGYFGALTQAGVKVFQTQQNIVTSGTPATTGYGRVGPTTMARLNTFIGGGTPPINVSWDTVPVLSVPTISLGTNSATFTWSTNEATQGQVFYSTSGIQTDEATGLHQQPFVSGTLAQDAGGLFNHTIMISSLQSNTTYYYVIRSIDSVGNVSMDLQKSFHTN